MNRERKRKGPRTGALKTRTIRDILLAGKEKSANSTKASIS